MTPGLPAQVPGSENTEDFRNIVGVGPFIERNGHQQAIALVHFDPERRSGRIGEWVRACRPDLLP
jgi:hypothetical protein